MSITVKSRQSTFDLATQHNGDVRSVLDFCVKNEIPLAEDIQAGTQLENEENTIFKNELVISYFSSKNQELATGQPKTLPAPLGIGSMIIESSFIVD